MSIESKPHKASSSALAHLDRLLDEALEQTFPASDAVAIDIERESHDTEARVLDSRTAANHAIDLLHPTKEERLALIRSSSKNEAS